MNPDHALGWIILAREWLVAGNLVEVKLSLDKAHALDNTSHEFIMAKALYLRALHKHSEALTVLQTLSEAQLEACADDDVEPRGGIAFDTDGNFYVADSETLNILKFDSDLNCSVFVTTDALRAFTGGFPALRGGIAFGDPGFALR